jgi:hypothetical protein
MRNCWENLPLCLLPAGPPLVMIQRVAQYLENRVPLDLSKGFFLHVVVKFNQQQHDGRKTFFEAGEIFGGPKVSIYLDDGDSLKFEATDLDGVRVSTEPLAPNVYGRDWLVLWCGLTQSSDRTELTLFVNGAVASSVNVPKSTRWGSRIEVNSTLGVNLVQQEACAFSLAEILVAEGVPTDAELTEMLSYVHGHFKLPDAGRPFELKRHLGSE